MANSKDYLAEGYKETIVLHDNIDPPGKTQLSFEVKNGELILKSEIYTIQSVGDNKVAIEKAASKLIRLKKKIQNDFKKKKALEKRTQNLKATEEKRKEKEERTLKRKKKIEAQLDAQRTSNYWTAKSQELTKEWEGRKLKLNCDNDLVLLQGFISASGIRNVVLITKEEKKIYDFAVKESGIKIGKRK